MREILFRGKRVDNGEWVEGNLFIDDKKEICVIVAGNRYFQNVYDVDPNIVCEYVGLCDINGKKIFENDIVKDKFGNIGKIFYSKHFMRWQVGFYKGREDLCKYPEIGIYIFDWIYPDVDLEVIGTVFDNPELLEGV